MSLCIVALQQEKFGGIRNPVNKLSHTVILYNVNSRHVPYVRHNINCLSRFHPLYMISSPEAYGQSHKGGEADILRRAKPQ